MTPETEKVTDRKEMENRSETRKRVARARRTTTLLVNMGRERDSFHSKEVMNDITVEGAHVAEYFGRGGLLF